MNPNHDHRSDFYRATLASLKTSIKAIGAEIRDTHHDYRYLRSRDARAMHLAYGLLRNRTYRQLEATTREPLRWVPSLYGCASEVEFQTWVLAGDLTLQSIRESALVVMVVMPAPTPQADAVVA